MLDASFLIVVAVALCLVSGMIAARMAAGSVTIVTHLMWSRQRTMSQHIRP